MDVSQSLLDDLRTEPQPKMWQKFGIEGNMHKEFVPPGQMVNGIFYCEVLRRLRENIWRKCPDKWCNNSWALHHDNYPTHALLVVQQFLASTKTTVIPHSPYSPDLTTCDFSLSWIWNCSSRSDILTALKRLQDMMKMVTQKDFQQCFWSWKSCWDCCINAKRDYFKGDGRKYKFW